MTDVFGWATVALVLVIPVLFIGVGVASLRHRDVADGSVPSSGGLLGFDELFHPAAHDARLAWEAEQQIPVPAPTPDRGPGVIANGKTIVIEVAD
ncbi:hypothetical protein [Microbacterium invictum]|uniref:PASTA domain-containing protein n=1 Tax=Microbacterium invictum TaxID=515415 RepID=A0ABZ0VD92_9MICO|nr:hypothetical protein [Microbacterium invictum]WQB71199.1 hypothetical protein T9R20_04315 [Microbacterium invictum]